MADKFEKCSDVKQVKYSPDHWSLLAQFRQKAMRLLSIFEEKHTQPVIHGSIARGDVNKDSDIDIFILNAISSFQIESILNQAKISILARTIIQATPKYAVKAYIEIDHATTLSFPLTELRRVEHEFYRYSGEAYLSQLKSNVRVKGVDKRLMLIEPNDLGHIESCILDKEEHVAKTLEVSVETVRDRVHALVKRDLVGRTGVFVKRNLTEDETFEMALKRLAKENPAVRRRINYAKTRK